MNKDESAKEKEDRAEAQRAQRQAEKQAAEDAKLKDEQAAQMAKVHAEQQENSDEEKRLDSDAVNEQIKARIASEQEAAQAEADRINDANKQAFARNAAPAEVKPDTGPDYGNLDQQYTLIAGNWIAGRFEGKATVLGGEIVASGFNPKVLWERGDIFVHPDHMPTAVEDSKKSKKD